MPTYDQRMPTYDQRMPTYDQRMPTYDQRMTNVFVAYVCRVRRILNVPSAYNEHVTYAAVERIYKGPRYRTDLKHIIPAEVIKESTCLPRRSRQPGADAEEEEKAGRP